MPELKTIVLKTPIEVLGRPRSEIAVRHEMRVGDLAAVQRYARAHGLDADLESLLASGDIGAMCALADSLCQLPEGTCEQLTAEDFAAVVEAITPFFIGPGHETGEKSPGGS